MNQICISDRYVNPYLLHIIDIIFRLIVNLNDIITEYASVSSVGGPGRNRCAIMTHKSDIHICKVGLIKLITYSESDLLKLWLRKWLNNCFVSITV